MAPRGPQWALCPLQSQRALGVPGAVLLLPGTPQRISQQPFSASPGAPLCPHCALVSLQWRRHKAPSTRGGEPSSTPVIARKLADVPRLLPPQTPRSISVCAPEAAAFSPNVPRVPKNVQTQAPDPTVPAGLPVDSSSQSARASEGWCREEGLPPKRGRVSPVGRGGKERGWKLTLAECQLCPKHFVCCHKPQGGWFPTLEKLLPGEVQ